MVSLIPDRGITPLLRACHSGIVEAVEYLLQVAPEGAWLDYSDSGMNALQYALDCAFPTAIAVMNAVLDTLRAHPGRATDAVSHVNERGWTVVHMAATAGRMTMGVSASARLVIRRSCSSVHQTGRRMPSHAGRLSKSNAITAARRPI